MTYTVKELSKELEDYPEKFKVVFEDVYTRQQFKIYDLLYCQELNKLIVLIETT